MPPALVLGWHKAFTRRSRSLGAVARLALPLLLIVVALSAWTTIDRFHGAPERIGLPAALSVRADASLDDGEARELLESDPQVAAAHPGVEVAALVPGQTATIALRGYGTHEDPYPFALAEGRPHGPDEAVAGQGLLDLLHVRVGDWVRMTVGDRPQILHIVGRSIEPENAGRVISTSSTRSAPTTRRCGPASTRCVSSPARTRRRWRRGSRRRAAAIWTCTPWRTRRTGCRRCGRWSWGWWRCWP